MFGYIKNNPYLCNIKQQDVPRSTINTATNNMIGKIGNELVIICKNLNQDGYRLLTSRFLGCEFDMERMCIVQCVSYIAPNGNRCERRSWAKVNDFPGGIVRDIEQPELSFEVCGMNWQEEIVPVEILDDSEPCEFDQALAFFRNNGSLEDILSGHTNVEENVTSEAENVQIATESVQMEEETVSEEEEACEDVTEVSTPMEDADIEAPETENDEEVCTEEETTGGDTEGTVAGGSAAMWFKMAVCLASIISAICVGGWIMPLVCITPLFMVFAYDHDRNVRACMVHEDASEYDYAACFQ